MSEEEILEKRLSILFMIIFIKFQENCDLKDILRNISPAYLRNKWEGIMNTDYENLERILHPDIIGGKEERKDKVYEKSVYENYKELWEIK